jgi:hypothetical protein
MSDQEQRLAAYHLAVANSISDIWAPLIADEDIEVTHEMFRGRRSESDTTLQDEQVTQVVETNATTLAEELETAEVQEDTHATIATTLAVELEAAEARDDLAHATIATTLDAELNDVEAKAVQPHDTVQDADMNDEDVNVDDVNDEDLNDEDVNTSKAQVNPVQAELETNVGTNYQVVEDPVNAAQLDLASPTGEKLKDPDYPVGEPLETLKPTVYVAAEAADKNLDQTKVVEDGVYTRTLVSQFEKDALHLLRRAKHIGAGVSIHERSMSQ